MYIDRQCKCTMQTFMLLLQAVCIHLCKQIAQGWLGVEWVAYKNSIGVKLCGRVGRKEKNNIKCHIKFIVITLGKLEFL